MKNTRDLYKQIGLQIKAIREVRKITQSNLADTVGLGRTSITNIEKGRQSLLVHTLYELADALDTNVAQLMPGPGSLEVLKLPGGLSRAETRWIHAIMEKSNARTPAETKN